MSTNVVFTVSVKRRETTLFSAKLDSLPRQGEIVVWENNKYVVDLVIHIIDPDAQNVGVTLKKL